MYIVEIEEIYIRYGRTYGRYIYIHIRKISIGITCVGLASARPKYTLSVLCSLLLFVIMSEFITILNGFTIIHL